MAPPKIQTYHCLCSNLLLTSTHTLSSLPRRSTSTSADSSSDSAIILPLPSTPPALSPESEELPAEGYTLLLSLTQDRKPTLVRREDGFEKRLLYRCGRCRLVVGYTLDNPAGGEAMDIDGGAEGEERYKGKVIYILPGGVMSTDFMVELGKESGKKIGEGNVDLGHGGIVVFE
ncbi:hypothetical protein BDZ45DRAFT_287396 [Acephala macrosclerotiorum]|nr:hypothetical protein BDZ45DRAFT_287396 [Acephala macrosclerotiorum]